MKALCSRTRSTSVVLALCALAEIAVADDRSRQAVQEIEALEIAHNKALISGDVATLENMMSDDYTLITTRGELRSRAEVLRVFSNPKFNFEYRQVSDIRIRVYGDTAIVTGRATQSVQRGGKDNGDTYIYTRIYVRRGGAWLAVALQATRVESD